jgi:hypothetical protein
VKPSSIRTQNHFSSRTTAPRSNVNLPKSRKLSVVDCEKWIIEGSWRTGTDFANSPMALDEKDQRLFMVTRWPARLLVFDTWDGVIMRSRRLSAMATRCSMMQRADVSVRPEGKGAFPFLSSKIPIITESQHASAPRRVHGQVSFRLNSISSSWLYDGRDIKQRRRECSLRAIAKYQYHGGVLSRFEAFARIEGGICRRTRGLWVSDSWSRPRCGASWTQALSAHLLTFWVLGGLALRRS